MARSCDPAKAQFWRQILARRQASGLTIRAFCEAHELSEQNFYRWQRLLAQRPDDAAASRPAPKAKPTRQPQAATLPLFVPLDVDVAAATGSALEVVLTHGRSIRVRPGFDGTTLRQLLACLEGPGC